MAASDLARGMLVPLLLAVIYYDLRYMLLPNWLAALFVVLFAVTLAWVLPGDVLAWRLGVALGVLLLGMAANAAGLLGGGDVKVLAALVLFVPYHGLLAFSFVFCVSMIAGIVVLVALRAALRGRAVSWRGLQENGRYPVGISIGLAGLIAVMLGG
ncbi:MAG: prepilin peptidase [Cypionkella sp.]